MSKSFIKSVRIKGFILAQVLDLDSDAVHFVNPDTDKDLFIIDHSGYTKYITPEVNIVNEIGKFGYQDATCKFIKFTFDETFLSANTTITQKEFTTYTGDFIEAERTVIERLMLNYPDVFIFSSED